MSRARERVNRSARRDGALVSGPRVVAKALGNPGRLIVDVLEWETKKPVNGKPQPTDSPPIVVQGSRRGQPGRPRKGDRGLFGKLSNGHILGTAAQEMQSRSGDQKGA